MGRYEEGCGISKIMLQISGMTGADKFSRVGLHFFWKFRTKNLTCLPRPGSLFCDGRVAVSPFSVQTF
jgi:hypothetical protein